MKKDSWVEGWAGCAVVPLGAARVELLVGVLLLGSEVCAASSRGRLTGGATIALLVLDEFDRWAIVDVFTMSTLLLESVFILLAFLEMSD